MAAAFFEFFKPFLTLILLFLTTASAAPAPAPPASAPKSPQVVKALDVAPVWSGHPVGFALLTHGNHQFAGFYDAQRRLTIASRTLDADTWTLTVLPTAVKWDSHNYIEIALDDDAHLHVAANMHGNPLIYFRTARPRDAASLERVESMVGRDEQRCTYPRFLHGPADELIFTYRSGGSGDGVEIYNVYDRATRTWSRLLDRPLLDGQGDVSAYPHGPVRGPDGFFHLAWVWRDTPDCATNHDLSYARSRDLRTWETGAGKPLALPITPRTGDVIDPVPPGGGMINGNVAIGFDAQQRPVVSYHKHDAAGHTQVYNARLEDGAWKHYPTSDWSSRWDFSGGGSIVFDIRVSPVRAAADGTLTQPFQHAKHGAGVWTLDPATLKPVATAPRAAVTPPELNAAQSDFPGMQAKWLAGKGSGPDESITYHLRWETLPTNRDKPRHPPLPLPAMLRLYELKR